MPLGSPKKRVLSKKSFSFQFKEKRRARGMQSLRPWASSGCCRTSFASARLTFSGQTRHDSPKISERSKNSFSFQLKKRGARVTCNGSRFEDFADSIIYYIIRACFKGDIALREAISTWRFCCWRSSSNSSRTNCCRRNGSNSSKPASCVNISYSVFLGLRRCWHVISHIQQGSMTLL